MGLVIVGRLVFTIGPSHKGKDLQAGKSPRILWPESSAIPQGSEVLPGDGVTLRVSFWSRPRSPGALSAWSHPHTVPSWGPVTWVWPVSSMPAPRSLCHCAAGPCGEASRAGGAIFAPCLCFLRLQPHLVTFPAGESPAVNLEALAPFRKFIQGQGISEKNILVPAHVGESMALPVFLLPTQHPPRSPVSPESLMTLSPPPALCWGDISAVTCHRDARFWVWDFSLRRGR